MSCHHQWKGHMSAVIEKGRSLFETETQDQFVDLKSLHALCNAGPTISDSSPPKFRNKQMLPFTNNFLEIIKKPELAE